MDKFTVIEGGKSQPPGETHPAPDGMVKLPVEKVCKSGLLISFDGTLFEKLPGVKLVSAGTFPDAVIMALITATIASEEARGPLN